MLTAFLTGWLSDRMDQKRLFLAGAGLGVFVPVIYYVSDGWRFLVPAFILAGLSEGLIQPAWTALYANSVSNRERGTMYGFMNIFILFPVLFAGLIGGAIAGRSGGLSVPGISPIYVVQAALLAAVWLIVYAYLSPGKTGRPTRSFSVKTMMRDYRSVFSRKGVRTWTAMKSLGSLTIGLAGPFWMVYAAEVHGASASVIGVMVTLRVLTQIVLSMVSGRLTDAVGRKKMILGGRMVMYLSAFVFLFLGDHLALLLASWVLMGITDSTAVAWSAEEAELVMPEERARMTALSVSAFYLLAAPASVFGGWLWDSVGKITPFLIMMLIDGFIRMPMIYLYVPESKHIDFEAEAKT